MRKIALKVTRRFSSSSHTYQKPSFLRAFNNFLHLRMLYKDYACSVAFFLLYAYIRKAAKNPMKETKEHIK